MEGLRNIPLIKITADYEVRVSKFPFYLHHYIRYIFQAGGAPSLAIVRWHIGSDHHYLPRMSGQVASCYQYFEIIIVAELKSAKFHGTVSKGNCDSTVTDPMYPWLPILDKEFNPSPMFQIQEIFIEGPTICEPSLGEYGNRSFHFIKAVNKRVNLGAERTCIGVNHN